MKYLKSYNESIDDNTKVAIETIEDMSLELEDAGSNVSTSNIPSHCKWLNNGEREEGILIMIGPIVKLDRHLNGLDELSDFLKRSNKYLIDNGYTIFKVSHDGIDDDGEYYEDARSNIRTLLQEIEDIKKPHNDAWISEIGLYYTKNTKGNNLMI